MEVMRQKILAWMAARVLRNWPVIVSVILLIGVFVSALLAYFQSTAISGPFSTLLAYCHYLEAQDYPAAYALLDDASRGQFSANDFALFAAHNNGSGRVVDCHVQDVRTLHLNNSATGKIEFSYSNDGTRSMSYTLDKQGTGWKLAHIVVSSPGAVLSLYCQAITARDYHTAYMLWSKYIRAGLSEVDFTQKFTLAFVEHCKAAPAHEQDTIATTTIRYGYSSGVSTLYVVQLINDDGLWFLNDQQQE
jgi:hypothetical protein